MAALGARKIFLYDQACYNQLKRVAKNIKHNPAFQMIYFVINKKASKHFWLRQGALEVLNEIATPFLQIATPIANSHTKSK